MNNVAARSFFTSSLAALFAMFVLFYASDAIKDLFTMGSSDLPEGNDNPLRQGVWFLLYAAIAMAGWQAWRSPFALPIHAGPVVWLLAGLTVMCLASTVWSAAPLYTLKRGIGLIFTTVFAYFLARRFTPRELCTLFNGVTLMVFVFTMAAVVVFPAVGIHDITHFGAWRGFFGGKNLLGYVALTCTFFTAFGALQAITNFERAKACGCFLMALFLLVQSTSGTSIMGFIIFALLLPLTYLLQRMAMVGVLITVAGLLLLIALFAMGYLGPMLVSLIEAMGRDTTLTDRIPLWDVILNVWPNERPLLGYGYEGFWVDEDGARSVLWGFGPWIPPHAHNGFLHVGVGLGYIGMAVTCGAILLALLGAIKNFFVHPLPHTRMAIIFIILFILLNVTERSILLYNSILWMVLLYFVLQPTTRRA